MEIETFLNERLALFVQSNENNSMLYCLKSQLATLNESEGKILLTTFLSENLSKAQVNVFTLKLANENKELAANLGKSKLQLVTEIFDNVLYVISIISLSKDVTFQTNDILGLASKFIALRDKKVTDEFIDEMLSFIKVFGFAVPFKDLDNSYFTMFALFAAKTFLYIQQIQYESDDKYRIENW